MRWIPRENRFKELVRDCAPSCRLESSKGWPPCNVGNREFSLFRVLAIRRQRARENLGVGIHLTTLLNLSWLNAISSLATFAQEHMVIPWRNC